MKLRNLFLAGLAACTLASCSKDDDIDKGQKELVDASLSITAAAFLDTKATTDDGTELLGQEDYVQTLTAYVFRVPEGVTDEALMPLAGKKSLTSRLAETYLKGPLGLIGIDHIVVKVSPEGGSSKDKFKVLLFANAGLTGDRDSPAIDLNVSNLKELKEATITKRINEYFYVGGQAASMLPMASEVLDITGLVPNVKEDGTKVENWIDMKNSSVSIKQNPEEATSLPTVGAVTMTRLVARVQVDALTLNITNNYPGAKFDLLNLSLVNVRPTATLQGGNGDWVKGFQSEGYKPADKWIYEGSKNGWEAYQGTLSKSYSMLPINGTINWPNKGDSKFYAYAFSNNDATYKTALLITGKFYRNASDLTGEVRNFRVFLQDPADTNKTIQVLANHVYKLTVTITGEGSPNEDEILSNAHVAATITVNPWKVINQEETTD